MKNVTLLGIDLAKDVFQLHGVNEYGKKILGKKVSRLSLPTLGSSPKIAVKIHDFSSPPLFTD